MASGHGGKERVETRETASDVRSRSWILAAVALGLGLGAVLFLTWGTVNSLVQAWTGNQSYGHGFLIVPVSWYLFWRARKTLARLSPMPSLWGLGLVGLAAFIWLLGDLAGVVLVQQLALVAMIQALCLAVLGWHVVRWILFPLFYLYFAVPYGEFLIAPLQDFTAEFVVRALRMVDIPVYLDGIFIYIPTGTFEVAEACAGLRFLLTSFALGLLISHLLYRQFWRRALFVGLSLAVPIVANGFRAFGIVMIAHLSGYEAAAGADHLTFGLIFLSIVLLCLLGLGMTFREESGLFRAEPAIAAMPVSATTGRARRLVPLVLILGSGLLFAAVVAKYTLQTHDPAMKPPAGDLASPAVTPPWQLLAQPDEGWRPVFPSADAELFQSYANGVGRADLYLAYYSEQRQGAEVVSWANRIADGETWERIASGESEAVLDGERATVGYIRMRSRTGFRLAWQWYWVDGQFTANPYWAKLLEIKAKLLGGARAAAVVVVASDYDERPSEASRLLEEFVAHLGPIGLALKAAEGR
jgi:exosortase A